MTGTIIYEPHDCGPLPVYGESGRPLVLGTTWECDDCGDRWTKLGTGWERTRLSAETRS